MKWKILIGESGGTKTDWCLVDAVGKRRYFTTESYHPRYVNDQFMTRNRKFWNDQRLDEVRLVFFGAGCLKDATAEQMKEVFSQLGFSNTFVYSDLLAAAWAADIQEGWCAICGTGSVAFQVETGSIKEIRGGKGHVEGDEGSGYYFGKLLMEQLAANAHLRRRYEAIIRDDLKWEDLLIDPASQEAKKRFSQLPWIFRNQYNDPFIKGIHRENINQFITTHLDGCSELGVCGSYAFYNGDLFRELANEKDIRITRIIERPIERLTDYLLNTTAY